MVKETFQDDGFWGPVHILMLMDDTIFLSTSRSGLIQKIQKCQEFCKEYVWNVYQPEKDKICGNKRGRIR